MNDVLDELKSALSTAIGNSYTYYKGEVLFVPKSYLPAIMIFGTNTLVNAISTARDQYVHEITIRVVQDVAGKMDESGTGATIEAHEDLINIMEQRDVNGVPISASVLGVLRRNVTGTNYKFNNQINIAYKTLNAGEWFYIAADCTLEATTDLFNRS